MNLWEIAGAIFWLAALVEVSGFTFEAFSNTYVKFPIGGGAQPAPISQAPAEVLPGTPKSPKTGQYLSPPAALLTPVIRYTQEGSGTRALAGWLKVVQWANSPVARKQGWSTAHLLDWAIGQPWFGRFYDLTGWTPGGISNRGRP